MSLGLAYRVKVVASTSINPTMTATKLVYIDTDAPSVQISYIENCDRLFSVNESFSLEVHFNTDPNHA